MPDTNLDITLDENVPSENQEEEFQEISNRNLSSFEDQKFNLDEIRKYLENSDLPPAYEFILMYTINGYKQKEIAAITGKTAEHISWLRHHHEGFKKAFKELNALRHAENLASGAGVRKRFTEGCDVAQKYLSDLIEGKVDDVSTSLRASSCFKWLESAGHKAPERIEFSDKTDHTIKVEDGNYDPGNDPYVRIKKELEEEAKEMSSEEPFEETEGGGLPEEESL